MLFCHDHHLQNLRSYNRYPLQYGMGEEAAELRLDLGGLGRIMSCVAGKQVVEEHQPHHYHHHHYHYPLFPLLLLLNENLIIIINISILRWWLCTARMTRGTRWSLPSASTLVGCLEPLRDPERACWEEVEVFPYFDKFLSHF